MLFSNLNVWTNSELLWSKWFFQYITSQTIVCVTSETVHTKIYKILHSARNYYLNYILVHTKQRYIGFKHGSTLTVFMISMISHFHEHHLKPCTLSWENASKISVFLTHFVPYNSRPPSWHSQKRFIHIFSTRFFQWTLWREYSQPKEIFQQFCHFCFVSMSYAWNILTITNQWHI